MHYYFGVLHPLQILSNFHVQENFNCMQKTASIFIPFSVEGGYDWSNLQNLCFSFNTVAGYLHFLFNCQLVLVSGLTICYNWRQNIQIMLVYLLYFQINSWLFILNNPAPGSQHCDMFLYYCIACRILLASIRITSVLCKRSQQSPEIIHYTVCSFCRTWLVSYP